MSVVTPASSITIHQKIPTSVSVLPDGGANPPATQGAAPSRSAVAEPAKAPVKPAAAPAAAGKGTANQIAMILKEIARLQKQLASEQKQLASAEKSTPKGGGLNAAVTALESEVQSTIAALLKATAALATLMSTSSGVDLHA
jgi:hypothetical protein